MFNTTIHGHNGDDPDDDNDARDVDEGTTKSTPYYSTVKVVTPEDAIRMEKCILFTNTLMLLLTSLHGSVCK